ncbi:N-acetylglucosamine-1-phosphotransferase subunits alpha/beta-like [Glandiceps talaboti]
MTREGIYKLVQRQTYTCLSQRNSMLLCFGGVLLTLISAFQFGEVALEWSKVQYEVLFSIYSDNLVSRSFQDRMCLPVPIDVVYTWVNGTDPHLLADLKRVKAELELKNNLTKPHSDGGIYMEGNQTKEIKCKFKDCIPSNFLIINSETPRDLTLDQLKEENLHLHAAVRMYNVSMVAEGGKNFTVIQFPWKQSIEAADTKQLTYSGQNISSTWGFLTSDWTAEHSVILQDTIMMTGLPKDIQEHEVWDKLPGDFRDTVENIDLYEKKGIAVLTVPDTGTFKSLLYQAETLFSEDSGIRLIAANLVWLLHYEDHQNEDIAANRFEDNEELRYSLRSIERFAPWVRHVFIVTNGQIPSWLNLDSPRLTIVTHEDIFANSSHLPTFGSPAIESHLHSIPGLSQKFIYLNDDVMFGKEVWPDDFYTHSRGQKVYLTWPVPNCNEGCPSSWIKDGYCDKACNISECEWDGGDCQGVSPNFLGGGFGGDTSAMYCSSGCANGWVADRYCDQSCNVGDCGFDAGDCGTQNFDKIYSESINKDTKLVVLPQGLQVAFFNVTPVFIGGSIASGKYDQNPAVRTATVSNKHKTVHLLVYANHNTTNVTFYLEGKDKEQEDVQLSFNVSVNTNPPKGAVVPPSLLKKVKESHNITISEEKWESKEIESKEELLIFEDVPEGNRGPRAKILPDENEREIEDLDETLKNLPFDVSLVIQELHKQIEDGDLTEKGFIKQKAKIIHNYIKTGELPWQPEIKQIDEEKHDDDKANVDVEMEDKEDGGEQQDENSRGEIVDNLGGINGDRGKPVDNLGGINDGNDKNHILVIQRDKEEKKDDVKEEKLHEEEMVQQPKQQQGEVMQQQDKLVQQPKQQGNEMMQQPILQQEGVAEKVKLNEQLQDNVKGENLPLEKNPQVQEQQDQDKQLQQNQPGNQKEELVKEPERILKEEEQIQDINKNLGDKQQEFELQQPQEKLEQENMNFDNRNENQNQKNEGIQENEDHNNGVKVDMNRGQGIKGLQKIKMAADVGHKDKLLMKDDDKKDNNEGWQVRKLMRVIDGDEFEELMLNNDEILKKRSFLPWEKQDIFREIIKSEQMKERQTLYENNHIPGRRLLDTFGDSLRHVNKLYNKKFGYTARKVPAHMPHMIDVGIMNELHDSFPEEFDKTSSHQVRHQEDMQFAFSYMYFMMSQTVEINMSDIFDEYDTDHSGALSDREIRTIATKIYELPLDLQTLTGLEKIMKDCAAKLPKEMVLEPPTPEQYYDKEMPLITKYLVLHCDPLMEMLNKTHQGQTKYKHEVLGDEEIAFKMIRTNVSQVIGQLDDVRRNPKKFICLNDNIEHNSKDAHVVKAVLQDFYESLFPIPSQFELPREYRNRFLSMDELNEWRRYRDWLKFWTHLSLACLVIFTLASFCSNQLVALKRKLFPERRSGRKNSQTEKLQQV